MEGLRGLSAFLVFFVHFDVLFASRAQQSPALFKFVHFAGGLGHCGVDVFFALSGFIIYGMLLGKPVSYVPFVRRRIERIYPVFTVVFGLYLAIQFFYPLKPLPESWWRTVEYLSLNYLLIPGIFPIVPFVTVAWSLSYEIFFYLTLPILLRALGFSRWPRQARIWSVASACVLYFVVSYYGILERPRIVMFGCGILLRETIGYGFRWTRAGSCAAIALFVLALAFCGVAPAGIWDPRGVAPENAIVLLGVLFAGTYALCYFALRGDGFLATWLSKDWIRWFGNMSYSFYLVHGLMLQALKRGLDLAGLPAFLPPVLVVALFALALALATAGSAIMFLLIEKPFSLQHRHATAPSVRYNEMTAAGSATGI